MPMKMKKKEDESEPRVHSARWRYNAMRLNDARARSSLVLAAKILVRRLFVRDPERAQPKVLNVYRGFLPPSSHAAILYFSSFGGTRTKAKIHNLDEPLFSDIMNGLYLWLYERAQRVL